MAPFRHRDCWTARQTSFILDGLDNLRICAGYTPDEEARRLDDLTEVDLLGTT
jgi:hypothetical protein